MVLSTQTVNVLRYTALGNGIAYGIYHQRRLNSQAKTHAVQVEYHHKEELIKQAKAQWARLNNPKAFEAENTLITDPDDARFDLEKFLIHVAGEDKASA